MNAALLPVIVVEIMLVREAVAAVKLENAPFVDVKLTNWPVPPVIYVKAALLPVIVTVVIFVEIMFVLVKFTKLPVPPVM